MDKDFHFGTIYVLSRWAGFGSYNSLVIASASQFVDDNTDRISNGKRPSGHELWENLTNIEENNEIWIPFHFLPGLDGNSQEEKLICKKNSDLAQSMMNELPSVTVGDSVSMLRLGIALHVYADTWAHQKFSGIPSAYNNVRNLTPVPTSSKEILEDDIAQAGPLPLGHMEASHYPDRPYLPWHCAPQFPDDGRNNWEQFIDASNEIYKILTYISNGVSSDLDSDQRALLLDAFQSIQDENIESRTQQWLDRIYSNDFGFTDFSNDDADVVYSTSLITDDNNFSSQFYTALDDHYNWVKNNLEANNINILD